MTMQDQDLIAEKAFYDQLFENNPENEHITSGYDELHSLAFPTTPEGTVLDLGCGTGAHAIRLARRGCRMVAVDLSLAGVRAARERFRREGLKGQFVVADAEHLPFKDGSFEVVWSSLLLHHFPKLETLPEELSRVTRRRLVALEPNAHNFLSWFAFNVVNRFWGLSLTTRNQRSLFPRRLHRRMAQAGFRPALVHFVHRAWSDDSGVLRLVRRVHDGITSLLPLRFRANKFLVVYERGG
ncbi:MAG TPA: class I SAM-dependent methyltransferase [Longimicrobiales bacterium]|nr:class I SAM-dependent methyltransferase [Longimicrobiales bacterium]